MIELHSDGFTTEDIGAAPVNMMTVVSGATLPQTPVWHKVRFAFWVVSIDNATREFHIVVTDNDGGSPSVTFADFRVEYTQAAFAPTRIIQFEVAVNAPDGLLVTIESDRAGDSTATATCNVYSIDTEYFEDFRTAAGSPTANSRTERIKTTDDNVTTLIGRITATLFSGMTSLAEWLGAMAGKQASDATAQTEMRATGAASGTFDATTDSEEALRDRGDAAWITATSVGLTAAAKTIIEQAIERTAGTGAVYYVATKGNGGDDSATGLSPDVPKLSPKTIIEAATAGDVVIIGPGTYGLGADTFVDGAFTNADLTLTEAGEFGSVAVGDKLILSDNGSGEVASGVYTVTSIAGAPNAVVLSEDIRSGTNDPTDVVWNDGDAGITAPDGVIVRGSGMDTTVIASTAISSSGRIFDAGSRATYSDFTIHGTLVPIANDSYQLPFGTAGGSLTETVCRRMKFKADTDGIYFNPGTGPASLKLFDCVIESKFDGVVLTNTPGSTEKTHVEMTRTNITVAGPSGTGQEISRGVTMSGATGTVTLRLFDCHIDVTNGGTSNTIGMEAGANATIEMYGGSIYARDDSNPNVTFDASQSSSGVIELIGVEHDRDNTSGTIVYSAGHERDLTLTLADTADMQPKLGTPDADVSADIAAVKADLPNTITKNVALAGFPFFMVLTSDHVTGATSKTVTAQRSLDGGTFGNAANSVVEIANGIYKIDLADTDLNGDTVCLKFTAAACDARIITIVTKPT